MGRILLVCACSLLLFVVCSCTRKDSAKLDEKQTTELHDLAVALTGFLNAGDEEAALTLMDDAMQKAMKGKIAQTWDDMARAGGAFIKTSSYQGFQASGYDIIEHTLEFENSTFIQRTVFNSKHLVSGLFFRAGQVEVATIETPDGVSDEVVSVDAGIGYPLSGMLTLPAKGTKVAVVLIHGSGPLDKDETVGVNKPFRDIAYGLAERGIAVLRYDKRTFAHRAKIIENAEAATRLTADEEIIEDAIAAYNLLKGRFERVYVLGHSLSGALLGEINAKGANYAGYIIMAGTPRKLYELSAEQNLLYAEEMRATGKTETAEQIKVMVQSELAKTDKIARMTDVEALKTENTIFTINAWYLRSLEGIDPIKQYLADGKPILILQGGRDRQINMTDFNMWQTGLIAHPNATFKLYPMLNHLMGEYKGAEVPFSQLFSHEYAQNTPVSPDVIRDIAEWIL